MSRDYMLICCDCRVLLTFGKVYWLNEHGQPLEDVTFNGVRDKEGNRYKRDAYFGRVMEKFLILHRNHELRFVPEGVDEFLEERLGFIESVDGDELLHARVEPEVNWWEEREAWKRILGVTPDESSGSSG